MRRRWLWLLSIMIPAISVVPSAPERVAWAEVAVSLSEGTEYKSFFLRGDEVQTLMGDLIDPTDEGMLAKLGGASGGVITEKRHHATLKPGEKVYAVVKVLKDVRIERMRAVLETEVTANPRGLSTAAALHQNYFQVKYIDFAASGGQVSYANAYIRDTSTQDRPFMIVTPSGDKLFYFSYQSCGGTAGIHTKITYHFTTGPAIVDVCPRQMFTSCYDIDTYLRDVPELTGDPCADWAYRYSKCFEEDIRNQVKCAIIRNTEPYVNVPGNPHVDEKTVKLRIDGFSAAELDAVVTTKDVRVGAVGVTTVNGVAVQQIVNPKNGMPETWLEVKFTVNQGAHGCQTIVVGGKTLQRPVCSPIPETFLKLISDASPKYVGQKVFAAYRVVGTTDNFAFNVATDGTHVSFPDSSYQRFNAGCVKYISPTALGVSSTVYNCAVIGSFIDEGVAPERGPLTFRHGTEVVCAPFQPVHAPEITITEIKGLRKPALGDFSQEADPHKPGRIFVDTQETWDGGVLVKEHYDKQRVEIAVRVTPNTIDPAKFKVRWELYDPDDPADHPDIDPKANDPKSHDPKGGDNKGKAHEGEKHWFMQADHAMGDQNETTAVDETTVIGVAKTVLSKDDSGNIISTAYLFFSDHGGDNFKVKVALVHDATDDDTDESGILAVWRKRKLLAYAMASDDKTGVFDAFPSGAARFASFIQAYGNADPNKNCYVDFACENAPNDARIGSRAENFFIGKKYRLGISVNSGGEIVVNLAGVTEANATAEEVLARFNAAGVPGVSLVDNGQRIIIDAGRSIALRDIAEDPILQIFDSRFSPTGGITAYRINRPENIFETSEYALFNTRFHVDVPGNHFDNVGQLIGAGNVISRSGKTNGPHGPHSYVNVEHLDERLLAIASAGYPNDEFPIDSGDTMKITTNKGETTVVFKGDSFDGSATTSDISDAINTASGSADITASPVISEDGVKKVKITGGAEVTSIIVESQNIPDNLGFTSIAATKATDKVATSIHEIGHTFIQQSTDGYHLQHTVGSPCAADAELSHALFFCPRHVRGFRSNITRSWSPKHEVITDQ